MDEVEWFNYPHTSAHPRGKVSYWATELTFIVALLVLCRGQHDGEEICIMLESGPTHSLVTKLLQCLSHVGHKFSIASDGPLWTKLWMGVCEALLPDVMVPETHQNDCSYVCELSGPSFNSLHKNLAWWVVKWRTSKKNTRKCQNWGMGTCPGQYYNIHTNIHVRRNSIDCIHTPNMCMYYIPLI